MIYSPNDFPRRAGISIGKTIAIASISACLASALTTWLMVRFVDLPSKPTPSLKIAVAGSPTTRDRVVAPPNPGTLPLAPTGDEEAGPELQLPAGPITVADATSTAADTSDLIGALQSQFDTNPFFAGRTGLKSNLNEVQAAATQMQQALADPGTTPEENSHNIQALSSALDKTIIRLSTLEQNTKNAEQVEAVRMINVKLQEMRATLP